MLRLFFKLIMFITLMPGCSSDIALVEKADTKVVVDSFIQSEPIDKLDILVTLDTSGSMSDNYDDVGNGMDLLRADIENLVLDYRFGFITADSSSYNYVGPYDSDSSSIDLLMAPSLLGPAHREEAFASTYTFFNSEDITFFRRDEADFLLFLISDEDEQSQITADLFYDWLQDEFYEVRHDVVTVTQVEGGECTAVYGYGYKYIELSNLYGKDSIDICVNDWSDWLSESSFLTNMLDYVQLSETPIVDTIVVYHDRQIIYDWKYSEGDNIVFLDFVPDYGSLIEVGYEVEIE